MDIEDIMGLGGTKKINEPDKVSEVSSFSASQPSSPMGEAIPTEKLQRVQYTIDDLLKKAIELNASDLHLKAGSPPGFRIRGELIPMEGADKLSSQDVRDLVFPILTQEKRAMFEKEKELDFAYSVPGVSRFRVNLFLGRGAFGAVFRAIPYKIKTIDELGLPEVLKELALKPRGLVLVTGPTGSGKSTTLAAMVDYINTNRRCHIMTIEDPIEFLHQDKLAYVNQREVYEDTHSFNAALKRVLRQDPDVILIGEMRDLETISAAVTAAETGHMVFATLHTTSAAQTVDRIIDVFPPHQQQQIRMQLSNVIEGVLCQTILPRKDKQGLTVAMEIMIAVPAIRNLIREGKTHMMDNVIQSSKAQGMQTLDQCLRDLVLKGIVSVEDALSKSSQPENLRMMIGRGGMI